MYYDSNNWIYLHLVYSEEHKLTMLTILKANLGERTEYFDHKVKVDTGVIELKIDYTDGFARFSYRLKIEDSWSVLVENVDVSYLSDEGVNGVEGEIGGFTGLYNFIGSVDSHQHDSFADFSYYRVINS